jgi:hypothetical protein
MIPLRRPRHLKRFNTWIPRLQRQVSARHHVGRRFRRSYDTSTAVYICPRCGLTCVVDVSTSAGVITGAAISTDCLTIKKEML